VPTTLPAITLYASRTKMSATASCAEELGIPEKKLAARSATASGLGSCTSASPVVWNAFSVRFDVMPFEFRLGAEMAFTDNAGVESDERSMIFRLIALIV